MTTIKQVSIVIGLEAHNRIITQASNVASRLHAPSASSSCHYVSLGPTSETLQSPSCLNSLNLQLQTKYKPTVMLHRALRFDACHVWLHRVRQGFSSHDLNIFFFNDSTAPWGPRPPHYRGFTITLRHTTLGRTPLDEWSARHRDLWQHKTQQTDIHTPADSNPQSQQASGRRPQHSFILHSVLRQVRSLFILQSVLRQVRSLFIL
jgi:hypothetical protein